MTYRLLMADIDAGNAASQLLMRKDSNITDVCQLVIKVIRFGKSTSIFFAHVAVPTLQKEFNCSVKHALADLAKGPTLKSSSV